MSDGQTVETVENALLNYSGPGMEEAREALDRLVAERDRLREAIEDYLLWEPGKRGHAEAHRKLAEALRLDNQSGAASSEGAP